MWARVVAGSVVSAALSEPTGSGWQEVADTPKPPDTPTTTWERGVEVSSGVPVVSWSPRDKTEAELTAEPPALKAALVARRNEAALRQLAINALASNGDYLALSPPTAAQVAAQVRALTQQSSALIRLGLGLLDSTG